MTREENYRHFGVPANSIVTLPFEDYLKGVVPSEIGNPHLEAAKAQAVAARTVAYKFIAKGGLTDKSSVHQSFRAPRMVSKDYPNAHKGVEDTKGQVLYYDGKLIATSSYSHANGGHTVSAEQKWGGVRPYLLAYPDPWDLAGSGGKKNGHGVGMSQTGAKYAASQLGKTYLDILGFYYLNTYIVTNYGAGPMIDLYPEVEVTGDVKVIKDMTGEKTNEQLVKFASQLIGQPYWYGTCVYRCTSSLHNAKKQQYPNNYPASLESQRKKNIANGDFAQDCVGLIKGFMWWNQDQQKAIRNSLCDDMGATTMFNKCTVSGTINTIPEIPGLCVWKSGHIGVYVGEGVCIEAKGSKYGVIESVLPNRVHPYVKTPNEFTHWGALHCVDYGQYADQVKPISFTNFYAQVNTAKDAGLNIWSNTNKAASLKKVKKHETIFVKEDLLNGWVIAVYQGVTGYVDKQYLVKIDTDSVMPTPDPEFGEITLQKGSKGDHVKILQEFLNTLNYNAGTVDGDFGPKTEAALVAFQKDHGLTANGIYNAVVHTALMAVISPTVPNDTVDDDWVVEEPQPPFEDEEEDEEDFLPSIPPITYTIDEFCLYLDLHSIEQHNAVVAFIDEYNKNNQ